MAQDQNYQVEYLHWQGQETKIVDGRPVRFRDVCVHEIRVGDVEDPDLMVADPIWRWQLSDAGEFVMQHAVEKPYWIRGNDPHTWGHVYRVMARLSEQNEIFWKLKWGTK